jgi:hypothetical protein
VFGEIWTMQEHGRWVVHGGASRASMIEVNKGEDGVDLVRSCIWEILF